LEAADQGVDSASLAAGEDIVVVALLTAADNITGSAALGISTTFMKYYMP
jgi:hypothetical protein